MDRHTDRRKNTSLRDMCFSTESIIAHRSNLPQVHKFMFLGLPRRNYVSPRNDAKRGGFFSLFTFPRSLRPAFTLAEVLITLLIIGVVAAITIPIINNVVQDAQYKTAYKKAYSVLNQALITANSQDLLVDVNLGGTFDCSSGQCLGDYYTNFMAIMNQLGLTKRCTNAGTDYQNCWDSTGEKFGRPYAGVSGRPAPNLYAFIDKSGMAWTMLEWTQERIAIDTNGFKKPNQYGKDRFAFMLYSAGNTEFSGIPIKIVPYPDNHSYTCTGNKCETDNNYFGTSWLYN